MAAKRQDTKGFWSPGNLMDHMVESWREEHDPVGDMDPDPTPRLKDACIEVCMAFSEAFPKSWCCDAIATVEVNIQAWIRKHRPSWLVGREG